MRAWLAILTAFTCLATLMFGNFYWNERTDVSSFAATNKVESEPESEELKEISEVDPDLFRWTEHWPDAAREHFKRVVESGNTYKVAIVGSLALGEGNGWAAMLKEKLEDVFGESIEINIREYDHTSETFINEGKIGEVKALAADLILYEPFVLKDNGVVATADNHTNIITFINEMKMENNDAVVILQPPHKIRTDKPFYFGQVEALKEFAEENSIPYINHWTVWPGQDEIAEYVLSPVQYAPNEKGHKVWFEFLKEYFVGD